MSRHRYATMFSLRLLTCGETVSQPLCSGLADVELSADRTNLGNPVRRKLLGEHLSRLLLQGIRSGPAVRRVIECGLRTSDDHHEEFRRHVTG